MNKSSLGLIFILLGCSNTTEAAREINETAAASVDGQVQISNISGDISVTGWDKAEVTIQGELGANAKLKFEHGRRHVSISVEKEDEDKKNMGSSDLIVKIPQGSELTVNGISSDIEVRNVHGVQRLQAVSGEIEADVFEGDIEAKTMSGDVVIAGHGSSSLVTVTTMSGDSEMMDIAGELETNTLSGGITVRAGELTRVRIKTTNGDIEITANLATDGRFESETINGDIDMDLTQGNDLNVDIETFNGDIENCFGEKSVRKSKYAPGKLLRFSRGAGDRHVRIKTMNGDVDICADKSGN